LLDIPGLDGGVDDGPHAGLYIGVDLLAEELEAAEGHKAEYAGHAASQDRVQEDLVADVFHADLLDEAVGDDARGATGESAPALAPLQIMSVIRKGLIRVSPARAMPMGARTTVVAMLPGPMADSTQGRMKKTMGNIPHIAAGPLDGPFGQLLHGAV